MLHRISEYVRKNHIAAQPGFTPKSARFAIVCDAQGGLEGVAPLGNPDDRSRPGREFQSAPDYSQPELKFLETKSGHGAHFLLDSAATVALHAEKIDNKTKNKHRYFVQLVAEAAREADSGLLRAGAIVLNNAAALARIRAELKALNARPTDKVTLRVAEKFPIEETDWHAWWLEHRAALQEEMARKHGRDHTPTMRCFLTGELVAPARTLGKITKIDRRAGGSPMGNALIGFDKDAFSSYGLEQSLNAAMSEHAGKLISAGLDHLLSQPESSHLLPGVQVLHWFRQHVPEPADPLPFLFDPTRQERSAQRAARELLDAIRSGKRPDIGANEFYILLLSGTGGRVMVREWQEGPFEKLAEAVANWFSDLEIVNLSGARLAESPGIGALLTSLLPEKKRGQDWGDWVKPLTSLTQTLWDAAVRGLPIPMDAIARIAVLFRSFCLRGKMDELLGRDPGDNQRGLQLSHLYCRMALIKAYHLRKPGRNPMSNEQPYLNADHPDAAYHCGRLMAVLAELQRAALGDVGANVIQRYYAAASATPALVFGRLTRNATHHLNRLDPAPADRYQARLADIASRLGDRIPTTLSLEQQSLFALGYYQQIANDNPNRLATRARKSNTPKEES